MNKENKKQLLGFFGIFLFALIGIFPMILLYVYCNINWTFLAFFVGICSFVGYRLFKGEMNNRVIPAISIITFIVVIITMLYVIPALLVIHKDMGPIFDVLSILYNDIDFVKVIIKDTIIAFIFASFGIYIIYKKTMPHELVVKDNKENKKLTKKK